MSPDPSGTNLPRSGAAGLTVGELLDELAAETPGLASGSAAALTVAMAASLVTMAARRSRDGWPEAAGVAAQSLVLRARCVELARSVAGVFAAAAAALEAGSEIEEPLRRAIDPLLAIADAAADVARLAAFTAPRCEGLMRADAVAAAALAEGAARVATMLVAANLAVQPGDDRLAWAERASEAAGQAAREANEG
jgi:formiminotetrahydrofolate cyclodeaminase